MEKRVRELPEITQEFLDSIRKYDNGEPNILGHKQGEYVEYRGDVFFVLCKIYYLTPEFLNFLMSTRTIQDGEFNITPNCDISEVDTMEEYIQICKSDIYLTLDNFIEKECPQDSLEDFSTLNTSVIMPSESLAELYNSIEAIPFEELFERFKDDKADLVGYLMLLSDKFILEKLGQEYLDLKKEYEDKTKRKALMQKKMEALSETT